MTLSEKIDYLFSRINWSKSNLGADAIKIMNELKPSINAEIEKAVNETVDMMDHFVNEYLDSTDVEKQESIQELKKELKI